MMSRVGVVGSTSWGTTLAILIAREGRQVQLWTRTKDEASRLEIDRENRHFLPGTPFPPSLHVTSSSIAAFGYADLVLFVVPSSTLRHNARKIANSVSKSAVIVSATKGLEVKTGKRMSEILAEELPSEVIRNICALSGPNLAKEIIQGKLSTTVIASSNSAASNAAQAIITSEAFRVYTNNDIIGVEFGGALKNIIAIGAGICDGLHYGDNAKAAFITRGLAEIARLSVAAGATPLTLAGLAGMGDLIATCSSQLSRNYSVGVQLARGKSLDEIRASIENVAEGIDTTAAAKKLAKRFGVDMPITTAIHDIIFSGKPIHMAISDLLSRTANTELREG